MDFETVFKVVFMMTFALALPVGGYVGYRYAMMWLRRYEREGEMLEGPAQDPETQARLQQLEADVAELHGRLDFAERMLAQQHDPERLASGLEKRLG
jgi:hypothetical protein